MNTADTAARFADILRWGVVNWPADQATVSKTLNTLIEDIKADMSDYPESHVLHMSDWATLYTFVHHVRRECFPNTLTPLPQAGSISEAINWAEISAFDLATTATTAQAETAFANLYAAVESGVLETYAQLMTEE